MPEDQKLDMLGLYEGLSIEVLTLENELTFQGRLERVRNNSIQIRDAGGGELPPVLLNKEIKMRCTPRESQVVILRGQICGSTQWFWRVDRIRILHVQEKRGFFRQRINVSTKLSRDGEETFIPCRLLDISAGGVGVVLQCEEELHPNDLTFICDAKIVPEEEPFSFRCRIRRVVKQDRQWVYGCEFEEMSTREQDRLLRAIFITQRRERQGQQKRAAVE